VQKGAWSGRSLIEKRYSRKEGGGAAVFLEGREKNRGSGLAPSAPDWALLGRIQEEKKME